MVKHTSSLDHQLHENHTSITEPRGGTNSHSNTAPGGGHNHVNRHLNSISDSESENINQNHRANRDDNQDSDLGVNNNRNVNSNNQDSDHDEFVEWNEDHQDVYLENRAHGDDDTIMHAGPVNSKLYSDIDAKNRDDGKDAFRKLTFGANQGDACTCV